ncbi:TetR/AcrR family transcriptional regulator [Brotaphodocola sp.]|uniref:TetR/AcrR family transcriptional regulator n=1 Tax=Brotaphodocola sp. TaxID=3073577 RepID=UPI003D7D57E8
MAIQKKETVQAIMEAGREEFLSCGYEKASMRRIAQKASVTTGAIYGYFASKEALFEALTGDVVYGLLDWYRQVHEEFAQLPPENQPGRLTSVVEEYIPQMIHYIYENFEAFRLFFSGGNPAVCEDFMDQLAKIEEKSSREFLAAMRQIGKTMPEMSDTLIHILCRSFFQQIQEFVSHEVPEEQAVHDALILSRFQHAGWLSLIES